MESGFFEGVAHAAESLMLFESFKKHHGLLNNEKFLDFLMQTKVSDSSKFHAEADVSSQEYSGDDIYDTAITRILRNKKC